MTMRDDGSVGSHDCVSIVLPESYIQLELVYLPVGKYCLYPRMVYRQAMA